MLSLNSLILKVISKTLISVSFQSFSIQKVIFMTNVIFQSFASLKVISVKQVLFQNFVKQMMAWIVALLMIDSFHPKSRVLLKLSIVSRIEFQTFRQLELILALQRGLSKIQQAFTQRIDLLRESNQHHFCCF